MGKLKICEHTSLDGVIQHSADDGDFPYSDREQIISRSSENRRACAGAHHRNRVCNRPVYQRSNLRKRSIGSRAIRTRILI